jgi:hypothetical protein
MNIQLSPTRSTGRRLTEEKPTASLQPRGSFLVPEPGASRFVAGPERSTAGDDRRRGRAGGGGEPELRRARLPRRRRGGASASPSSGTSRCRHEIVRCWSATCAPTALHEPLKFREAPAMRTQPVPSFVPLRLRGPRGASGPAVGLADVVQAIDPGLAGGRDRRHDDRGVSTRSLKVAAAASARCDLAKSSARWRWRRR